MFKIPVRFISCSGKCAKKVTPNNLKGKTTSSAKWLTRQLNDPYVEKAKMLNYRCRSAFKLLEMDDQYKFLKPGQVVLDCGAAPGSWTQVAVERTRSETGLVIAIDRQQIFPIEGATILGNSDFTLAQTQESIRSLLDCRLVDVVLSDMAPNASGVRALDTESMLDLCYSVLRFALLNSANGAALVMKLWECGARHKLLQDALKYYDAVRIVKPDSSRADSAEIFLLARHFRGLNNKN